MLPVSSVLPYNLDNGIPYRFNGSESIFESAQDIMHMDMPYMHIKLVFIMISAGCIVFKTLSPFHAE